MTNPYAQVARTYMGQLLFQVVFAALLITIAAVRLLPDTGFIHAWPLLPLGTLLAIISLFVTQQAREQFGNPRARLLPGYAQPHLAILGTLGFLACGLVWLALVLKGAASPLGAAAFSLAVFALPAWMIYRQSWWSVAIFLPAWASTCTPPVQQTLVSMLGGGQPALAWALLAASIATLGWIGLRMAGLSEERPEYPRNQGSTRGDYWQPLSHQTNDLQWLKSPPWFVRPFLGWCDRRMDRLLAFHRPGGPLSLRLWRLPTVSSWVAWIFGAFLATEYLVPRLLGRSPGALIVFVNALLVALMPFYASLARQPILGYESLRPIARRNFLRTMALTIVADTALLLAVIFLVGVAVLLEDPNYFFSPQVGAIMVLAFVTPAIPCACTFWPGWRHHWLRIGLFGFVPAYVSVTAAFELVLDGSVSPTGGFLLAGAMVLIAVLIAWLAYRRWLVADFD